MENLTIKKKLHFLLTPNEYHKLRNTAEKFGLLKTVYSRAIKENSKLKELKPAKIVPVIQKVTISDGEILAIVYPEKVSHTFIEKLLAELKAKLPASFKDKILILDGNPKLTAISNK